MNQHLENILLSVAGNALTALIAAIGQGVRKLATAPIPNQSNTATLLRDTLEVLSETIDWTPPPPIEEVCLFLTSPETESILRQIYALRILSFETKERLDLDSIKKEFTMALASFTGTTTDTLTPQSDTLFYLLSETTERSLNQAIEEGRLSAHEVKSELRHRIIMDELSAIQKNINFLTTERQLTTAEFQNFEAKYREQVADRHKDIVPPHFDTARRLPIDKLYVQPSFFASSDSQNEHKHPLTSAELKASAYRIVILGNPGAGKSTFTQKACFDLATHYNERQFAGRRLTPVLVVLRDYGVDKKAARNSILQFMESVANTTYQVQAPEGAFEYLLLSGRLLIIFDGLDELLDTRFRQEITRDIESFCNLFPSTPIIVTSREVGYEQAPLDERFAVYRLAPFNETQVKDYAEKWFSTVPELSQDQKSKRSGAFLRESQIAPDLRSNPLMLSLMCNIYRGENYIPRNRPDLYEKCALMLFERWDKSRDIKSLLPFEAHIGPAMKFLAHWIYSNDKHQSGVSEHQLVKKTTDYLATKRFEDREEAARAADDFIRFCRGRAWIFTDTGTTKDGESLYQFTHRTFLEFFAASYIVSTNPTPKNLTKTLLPKILKREWDVVAQLAFQLQNKNVDGASEYLLAALEDQKKRNSIETWNSLSFAARCLSFMVPNPKTTRAVTSTILRLYSKLALNDIEFAELAEIAAESIGDLIRSATENQGTVISATEQFIQQKVDTGSPIEQAAALELGFHITSFAHLKSDSERVEHERLSAWSQMSDRLMSKNKDIALALSKENRILAIDTLHGGHSSVIDFINHHGLNALFELTSFRILPNFQRGGHYQSLIYAAMHMGTPMVEMQWAKTSIRDLPLLGVELSNIAANISLSKEKVSAPHWREQSDIEQNDNHKSFSQALDPDSLFAIFVLSAIASESTIDSAAFLRISERGALKKIYPFIVARHQSSMRHQALATLEKYQLADHQKKLITSWTNQIFSFIH